jgi:hypothetical protein
LPGGTEENYEKLRIAQRFPNYGTRFPWGAPSVLWGPQFYYTTGIFILNEIWHKINIYFGEHFACLKYFTYHLLLVPVLAPNYKQHILSPATVRKVCYSLAERYVKSVSVYSGGGGVKFIKHFKGGASCRSLGTSRIAGLRAEI